MAARNGSQSSAAIVDGIAWVMIVVSAWAACRLAYMAVTSSDDDDRFPMINFGDTKPLLEFIVFGLHALIAAFSVFAGIAMLRHKAWTRPYFGAMLIFAGAEIAFLGFMMTFTEDAQMQADIAALRLAMGVGLTILSLSCALLAWKLLSHPGIKAVLEHRSPGSIQK